MAEFEATTGRKIVSLEIKAERADTNATSTTTINYVNPEASNAKLLELAGAINYLSQDTYVSTTKVTKERLY